MADNKQPAQADAVYIKKQQEDENYEFNKVCKRALL